MKGKRKGRMRAIILAGGKGTRLWPLSRENYPKQFVDFIKGKSLFQLALKRTLSLFDSRDIFIVASGEYRFHIINQIEAERFIGKKSARDLIKNIILEPSPRSTAPAILLALKATQAGAQSNDVFFVFSSDHIIEPLANFKSAVRRAGVLAQGGYLVIFGILPIKPCSGYGHVLCGPAVKGGFKVREFVEKPSPERLKSLMRRKAYWNAGIFSFTRDTFLSQLQKHAPDIFRHYQKPYRDFISGFFRIRAESIDYAIMQKTQRAALVRFEGRWSDLGSWESVVDYYSTHQDNTSIGSAQFLSSQGCFSFSQDKLVSFLGMKDAIVVEDSDSILVMKKKFSDKVKELTALLKKNRKTHASSGLTVYRPWGYYTVLKEKSNYKVKEIGVYPKKHVSLQKHAFRSEHWNVVEGKVEIVVGKNKRTISKNESIFVPKGTKHKIYNPADKIAVIIEVQIGTYLGEDDIRRYETYAIQQGEGDG